MEDRAGVQLGPVVVNAADPEPVGLDRPAAEVVAAAGLTLPSAHVEALEAARRFRLERHAVSAEQVDRLARELPLPHLIVPALTAETIGPVESTALAEALGAAVAGLVAEGAER